MAGQYSPPISLAEIDAISNLKEGIKKLRELGIDHAGVKNKDDVVLRLRKFLKLHGVGVAEDPLNAAELMADALEEDKETRQQLQQLYRGTIEYISGLPEKRRDDLNQNIPRVVERLRESIDELSKSESGILVAGETGAGKSCLLNLLLGEDLLPTDFFSCTAVLCELRYGDQRRAVAHFWDTSIQPVTLDLEVPDPLKVLKPYIFQEEGRGKKEFPYNRVQLFWPIPLLQGGVYIMDSPGIGESEMMTKLTKSYLAKAFSFIYVINSMVAGGVQEDRLQDLLSDVVRGKFETEDKNSGTEKLASGVRLFNPSTAIFVLNKWDQVPEKEKDDVFKDTLRKLQNICDGFTADQLFPMSVTKAQSALKQGCATPELSKFLVGLKKLFPKTLKSNQETKYRLVVHILRRSAFHLKSALSIFERSEEERKKKAAEIMRQIGKIKNSFEGKRFKLLGLLKTKAQQAARQIKDYLNKNNERVLKWKDGDCPKPTDHWDDLYTQARTLILGRIRELLEEWNTNTEFFTNAQKELIGKFHIEFNIMENQVALLEGQLTSNNMLVVEDANPTGLRDVEDTSTFTTTEKVIIGVTSPIWIPIGLVAALFVVPVALGVALKDRLNEKKQIKDYTKHKAAVMETIAEKVLEHFMSEENLSKEVMRYLNSAVATLNNLLSAIPKLLDDDLQLIKGLLSESQTAELQLYQKKLQWNDALEGGLGLLYVTKIREDINANTEIYWILPAFATGTFGEVYTVKLLSRNNMKAAAKVMKQFATAENVDEAILEEESLRRLNRTPNIIKFIGTSAIIEPDGNRRLVILMEYCPKTLANRMLNADATSPKGQREIKNPGLKQPLDPGLVRSVAYFGMQICTGLRGMHAQGYIHRDLKPENILVTDRDEVRLADVGLTKPQCDITGTLCGTLVYMAPEILKKEKYGAPSDMFAIGVMLWEMWYGKRAYNLPCFENFENISDFLKLDWTSLIILKGFTPPPSMWCEKLGKLLSPTPSERPTASQIERFLAEETHKRFRHN
ncbi:uncharacterized protein LOC106174710 [Lingula anatina]|uniref:Uncharacterized protein LOC106174710 n=1 Tax=Lingula anatina TaxID=7574 RepID=A0A1S3JN89_LINAN|nr:uncharacterized protein LOC106174710 [Lingula anatina]|eukprot:XP_013411825.1 uncharacterized protein LOC106174710 [Lingula anatina]